MRVAVCISGQQRSTTIHRSVLDDRMHNAFSKVNADFYYHTWMDRVLYNYPKMHKQAQPKVDYHPVFDVKHKAGIIVEEKRKNRDKVNKFQHASKQILAHAYLCDNLNHKYDMIVRLRWDLYFSSRLDYKELLEQSYEEGVYGYGFQERMDYNLLDNPVKMKKQERRWDGMLTDNCIFHKPEWFDTSYVYKLHENKELLPAEWGFYQTMSEPYNDHHSNFRGGVITSRQGRF